MLFVIKDFRNNIAYFIKRQVDIALKIIHHLLLCTVPTFMQYVLTELIDSGDFEGHINRVRRGLRKQNK